MATPLRQLLNEVLFDPDSRSDFASDPGEYLRANGWSNLEGPELEEAVAALGDGLPVETALALDTVTASVDFAATDLEDVGDALAEVASQVDPDLPLHLEGRDGDLAFGSGSVSEAFDIDPADSEAFDIDPADSEPFDSDPADSEPFDSDPVDIDSLISDPFASGTFDEDVTEPMAGAPEDAGDDPSIDLGLGDDDLDFGIDG